MLAPLRLQEPRVSRPSLLRRLDRLTPLMRVSAPPGSGRTTLLADWALQRMEQGDHVLWVSAHRGLDSYEAFNAHLAQIARHVVPAGATDVLPLICDAHPHSRVILVVDDGHLLRDAQLRARLVDLCRRIPTLHMVGASDDVAPLPPDTDGTHLPVTVVTGRDLMITAAEAPAFARAWDLPLTEEDAGPCIEATGGWLGLLREVLDARHGAMTRAAADSSSADRVAPARVTAARIPPVVSSAVRRFRATLPSSESTAALFSAAGAAAQLGSVTYGLLEHLERTRPELWQEIGADRHTPVAEVLVDSGLLRTLPDPTEGQNADAQGAETDLGVLIGVGPHDSGRSRQEDFLTVPSVLRAALAHEFASTHPVRSRQLHDTAAAYFEDTGCPRNIIRSALHARRAHDWARLTRLAASHGWWLGARYGKEMVDAYGGIPDDAARTRPVLHMTRALALALQPATIEPDPRSPMVQRVFARAADSPVQHALAASDPDERAFLIVAMVNALRQRGEAERALRMSEELRPSLTPRWDEVSALNRAFFYLQAGLAAMDSGDLPRAVRRFTRSYEESTGLQAQFVACSAAGHIALILAFEGRPAAALRWAERAEDGAADEPWMQRVVSTPVLLAHAHVALDESDIGRARALLHRAGPLTAVVEAWPLLIDVHARLGLAIGTAVSTLDAIEHAAQTRLAGRLPGVLATALVTRARCALLIADGELTRAKRLIDRTLSAGTDDGSADGRAAGASPEPAPAVGSGSEARSGAGVGEAIGASGAGSPGVPEDGTAQAEVPALVRGMLSIVEARMWLVAGRYAQARHVVGASLARAPTRRQVLDMLVVDAAAALALGQRQDAARSIRRVVTMTPPDELAATMRAIDPDTRRDLLALVDGPRGEALPGPDDPLYTDPAMYPASAPLIELTEREASVLRGLADGASLAEIARSDVLSVNTVKKQAVSLYRKLGADNRADALRTAYEQGLLG